MQIQTSIFIKALQAIGAATAAIPEVKTVLDSYKHFLHPTDQAIADEAYKNLMLDNDEGHAKLQEMLKAIEDKK